MRTQSRLERIEEKINASGSSQDEILEKMRSFKFGVPDLGKSKIITHVQWETFKNHELEWAEEQNIDIILVQEKINDLEQVIAKSNDYLMITCLSYGDTDPFNEVNC